MHLPNKKPIHLCSFYRPPNVDIDCITELDRYLMQLTVEDSSHVPYEILARDFNFPDISWNNCEINSSPAYELETNQVFLDSINDNGLEQLILEPT